MVFHRGSNSLLFEIFRIFRFTILRNVKAVSEVNRKFRKILTFVTFLWGWLFHYLDTIKRVKVYNNLKSYLIVNCAFYWFYKRARSLQMISGNDLLTSLSARGKE